MRPILRHIQLLLKYQRMYPRDKLNITYRENAPHAPDELEVSIETDAYSEELTNRFCCLCSTNTFGSPILKIRKE